MKKLYFFLIMLVISSIICANPSINCSFGYTQNDIPYDWQNDLWLNSNFKKLEINETYQIVSRRIPEVINDPISNNVALPIFSYTLVEGESVNVSVDGKVTANSLGTSVVEVSYSSLDAYGSSYLGCSPVNKSYFIVDVVATKISSIALTSSLSRVRSTYDTYYFKEGDSYPLNFSVITDATLEVFCNGELLSTQDDGTYQASLKNKSNIIELQARKNGEIEKQFYVYDARKIELNIENITHPGALPELNDALEISFKGIVLPVRKLATIYNPCWEANFLGEVTNCAKVEYTNPELGTIKTNKFKSQYDLATKNTIQLTITKEGCYHFTNGKISQMWWGSVLGSEKETSHPGSPNLNADTHKDLFGSLPDFDILVLSQVPATFDDIALDADTFRIADVSNAPMTKEIIDTYTDGDFEFFNSASNFGTPIPVWNGIALSNQTDIKTEGGWLNQFNSTASGDIEGTGNYAIAFDMRSGMTSMPLEKSVSFRNSKYPDGKILTGMYVTNTTYAYHSMKEGDQFAKKKFGGPTGNDKDYFKLVVTGLDKEGIETASVEFYLADYRFENNALDYILQDWKWMDLTSLGIVSKVRFQLFSTVEADSGVPGIATPAYFCMDNINFKRLVTNEDLQSRNLTVNEQEVIDLSAWVSDLKDVSHAIFYTIKHNLNPVVAQASLAQDELTISALSPGIDTLVIEARYKKMTLSQQMTVQVAVDGTINLDKIDNSILSVYPNPSPSGMLWIATNSTESASLEVYNIKGMLVYRESNHSVDEPIDLTQLTSGNYIVKMRQGAVNYHSVVILL